ncbi:hypothetical protein Trydic_g2447 [Trypoxylus dichotomus]
MPRKHKNFKRHSEKTLKKSCPPGKSLKTIKAANVGLRRSERRTSNVFASSRITANRLTLPLTFLGKAIKSKTITNRKESQVIISELRTKSGTCGTPLNRRITRSWSSRFRNASSYYLNCISNQATCSDTLQSQTVATRGDTFIDAGAELDEPKEEFEEKQVEVVNLTTNLTIVNNTFTDKIRPVNYRFCHSIFNHIKIKLRSSKRDCIFKLKESITKLNNILEGKRSPSPPKSMMATKRASEDEYDACVAIPLVPQSQWVYSTPDKQNIKHFVFDEGSDKILPAVIRTSKNSKVLYDIKNEVMQQINSNKFKNGQNIPIDRRFLKTICESAIDKETAVTIPSKKKRLAEVSEKENIFSFTAPKTTEFIFAPQTNNVPVEGPSTSTRDEFNMFLSGGSEESIDIHEEIQRSTDTIMDVSFEERPLEEKYAHFDFRQCRSALPKESIYYVENDPYETAPVDYRHQLLLATQRPAKATRRIQKRHLLKAKSLSFENTPPGNKVAVFEPKRLDMINKMEDECLDHFEKEFATLNNATASSIINPIDMPHTITSGALNNTSNAQDLETGNGFDMKNYNDNVQNITEVFLWQRSLRLMQCQRRNCSKTLNIIKTPPVYSLYAVVDAFLKCKL